VGFFAAGSDGHVGTFAQTQVTASENSLFAPVSRYYD
jgi:hypothetical protein